MFLDWYTLDMFEFYGNTSVDFLIAIGFILILTGAGVFVRSILTARITASSKGAGSVSRKVLGFLAQSFGPKFYLSLGVLLAFPLFLETPLLVERVLHYALVIFLGFQVFSVFSRGVDVGVAVYVQSLSRSQKALATTLPSVGLLVKVLFFLIVFVFVLSNLGINVTTLLAVLGVGGLAFAFAFQKILADLFSTFVIFFDRPFSVGDVVEVGDKRGTVERVGVKTTHIRSSSGDLFVVPNSDLVGATVRTVAAHPVRKLSFTIPISYETDPDALRGIPEMVEKIVSSYKQVVFKRAQVSAFGKHGVEFSVLCTMEGASFDEYAGVLHEVHLAILSSLKDLGISLGYPVGFPASADTV